LRRIFDHDRDRGSSIQTARGYGYRFVMPVTRAGPIRLPVAATVMPGQVSLGDNRASIGNSNDMTTPHGRLVLTVLRGLAQSERDVDGK
jgi:hypothetical protein